MDNIRFDISATDKSKPAFDSVRASADKTSASVKQFDRNVGELTGRILQSAPSFAIATAAIAGVYEALRLVTAELMTGFNAVEEYRQSVIQMAAVMTNFSQKAKEGDIAGAWKEASAYAKVMVDDLELIDAKSLASGQNIIDMTRTMLTYGVQIDTNISSQRDALVTLSNAIAIATAGQQNANLQYVQEIRGLMEGVNKPGNVLVAILERAGVNVKQFSEDMQLGKKSVADLLPYLSGFMSASEEIAYSWGAIKTTLETTNKRVLRDAFLPIYKDILDNTTKLMRVFMDQNGVLTEQGHIVQDDIVTAWKELREIISAAATGLKKLYKTYQDIKALYESMPLVKLINFGVGIGEKMELYALRGGPLYYVNIALDEISAKAKDAKKIVNEVGGGTGAAHSAKKAQPPAMAAPPLTDEEKRALDDAVKETERLAKKWGETRQKLSEDVKLAGLDGLSKDLAQIDINAAKMRAEFGNKTEIDAWAASMKGAATSTANLKLETELYDNVSALADEKKKETLELLKQQNDQMEELSLAVLPEHAREVEAITRKYADWERQIEDLAGAGRLTMEEAQKWAEGLGVNMEEEYRGLADKAEETVSEISEFWKEGMHSMQNYSQDFFFNIMKGNFDDLGSSFEDMILHMVANWEAAQLQMALWGRNQQASGGLGNGLISAAVSDLFGLNGAFSSITGNYGPPVPVAHGGVMTGAGIGAYTNSVVARPTYFPFAHGIGLMGEAGHEAIMPLTRTSSGDLGVRATGGNVTVNVINNSSGAQATTSERTDGGGNRIIDVLIEQVTSRLGQDINRGKGLDPVLRSRYSLNSAWGMNR